MFQTAFVSLLSTLLVIPTTATFAASSPGFVTIEGLKFGWNISQVDTELSNNGFSLQQRDGNKMAAYSGHVDGVSVEMGCIFGTGGLQEIVASYQPGSAGAAAALFSSKVANFAGELRELAVFSQNPSTIDGYPTDIVSKATIVQPNGSSVITVDETAFNTVQVDLQGPQYGGLASQGL